MKISSRIILLIFIAFVVGLFYWAVFSPKQDVSERIYKTLKEQEKRADLSFKDVTFEEVVAGVKYWQLHAKTAMVNKSTQVATLKDAKGNFFKKGKTVLRFRSPAALWDMKKKEILLDKPFGYDVKLEEKIAGLIESLKKSPLSFFNLPQKYKKGAGYWFKANNLSWKLEDQMLLCTGRIILNKGEITGYAQRLKSDVGLERIILEGKPKVVIVPRQTSPVTIEAAVFEVLSPKDILLARGNPRIQWGDAQIFTNNIKYIQSSKVLELKGKVRINYRDIKAGGDFAKYFIDEDKIILSGNARALQGENKMSGEKVSVSLKDQKISVLGKGKVIISEEELN